MSLFPRQDLLRVLPIARGFAIGPGRVMLLSLEVYALGSVLRLNALGRRLLPDRPPLVENLRRLIEAGRVEETLAYLREHALEWQDVARGLGPAYGHALDFDFADDQGTQYGFLVAQASGNDEELSLEVDVTPPIPSSASRLEVTVYYTGRDWQEADKDPIDHSRDPAVTTDVPLWPAT